MKSPKLAASLIAVSLAATTFLTGCNNGSISSGNGSSGGRIEGSVPEDYELTYEPQTRIRIAAGYNAKNTAITFQDASIVGENGIKLPDGKTYVVGMLKPTWDAVSKNLNITFEDKYTGASASNEWAYWKDQLTAVDIIAGTASDLNEAGIGGKLVDLNKYINAMPNFKSYLDENPIVRLSITGYDADGNLGPIYFAPYFDGVNDIERMPLMRTDWVEKLLNGPGQFAAASSKQTASPVYQPYMPTTGKIDINVVNPDTSTEITTETITKDYSKYGNIVEKMNAKGSMSGVEAVNMLREYIDKTYDGYYGENRADLFIGQNAAWDADELVALLRCIVANPQTLNGTDEIQGIFSREDNNNQRRVDMYRLAAILFGARGLESRNEFMYVDNDKELRDARQEPLTYEAIENMYKMAQEGLISDSYINKEAVKSEQMMERDLGFMSYDYNQTQTIFNEDGKLQPEQGEKYRAVLVPVARWYDEQNSAGLGEPKYIRFTESWRSVKDSGWAVPLPTESNTDVLNACLKLFDYAFSPEGQILMSYGPDAFIDVKDPSVTINSIEDIPKKYNTFNFNGDEMPMISEATREALWSLSGGNYTNFGRRYLGSTLHFVKNQAFEVQCTTEVGREGAQLISNAIAAEGIIYHPELSTAVANPWYMSVPTILPIAPEDTAVISTMNEIASSGYFSTGSDGNSVLANMIAEGYSAGNCPGTDPESCASTVANDWRASGYTFLMNDNWINILNF